LGQGPASRIAQLRRLLFLRGRQAFRLPLLFIGNDFSQTDIRSAL
jgi:hypothetical protein